MFSWRGSEGFAFCCTGGFPTGESGRSYFLSRLGWSSEKKAAAAVVAIVVTSSIRSPHDPVDVLLSIVPSTIGERYVRTNGASSPSPFLLPRAFHDGFILLSTAHNDVPFSRPLFQHRYPLPNQQAYTVLRPNRSPRRKQRVSPHPPFQTAPKLPSIPENELCELIFCCHYPTISSADQEGLGAHPFPSPVRSSVVWKIHNADQMSQKKKKKEKKEQFKLRSSVLRDQGIREYWAVLGQNIS